MSQPPAFGIDEEALLFGKIAVENGLLSSDQLSDALMAQMMDPSKAVGQILIESGVMTPHTVSWVLQRQQAERQSKAAAPGAGACAGADDAPGRAAGGVGVATPVQTSSLQEAAALPSLGTAATPVQEAPVVAASAVVAPSPPAITGSSPSELVQLIQLALGMGASDLHLHAGTSVKVRVHGDLAPIEAHQCTDESNKKILAEILTQDQKEELDARGQVDFAYSIEGLVRMRCNAYRQQNGTDVAFRLVAPHAPTLAELNLPESLSRLASYHQGMVLFTGPTGCGKTSTLAALLNLVNESKPDHILTVEDPIEYIHTSKSSIVNQRQVKGHTESFARALRGALREDPDVIVIGELRDLETISLALTAAETGHLVLATMHTMNSIATINRLIGAFPPEEQSQIRTMVSESLRAVVSQRMVKKADGSGRVPALEILIANTAIANLIRDQKTFQIPGILQTGGSKGMCMLDGSLEALVKAGTITREEALANCDNPKNFQ